MKQAFVIRSFQSPFTSFGLVTSASLSRGCTRNVNHPHKIIISVQWSLCYDYGPLDKHARRSEETWVGSFPLAYMVLT